MSRPLLNEDNADWISCHEILGCYKEKIFVPSASGWLHTPLMPGSTADSAIALWMTAQEDELPL